MNTLRTSVNVIRQNRPARPFATDNGHFGVTRTSHQPFYNGRWFDQFISRCNGHRYGLQKSALCYTLIVEKLKIKE